MEWLFFVLQAKYAKLFTRWLNINLYRNVHDFVRAPCTQQSPTIIILPCTFHLEKTCSVGWSVWRVLKSSSWANATLPAQWTNHDMILSQKQSENIQEGKFEETRHNKLGSHAFVIICLHAWSWCFRWPIVPTFHLLSNNLKRRVWFS